MEKSLLSYVLTAAIIGTLLGAVVTYAFLIPRIDQIDSNISELETTISNLDDRLSVVEEYLSTPFSMHVIPDHMKAIVGQRCVFLVVVAEEGLGEGKAVSISASAFNASVAINSQGILDLSGSWSITPGQVAEVSVIPEEVIGRPQPEPTPTILYNLTVTITGERDGQEQTETATINVWTGEEELAPYATEVRDRFIPWLAANHPELGITNETEWNGTIIAPGMTVVSYYLFLSDDWEMGIRWHVTIVPHDYAEIYLRRRFVEVQPSHAFRIDSFKTEPPLDSHVIDPPETMWR